MPKSFLSWPTAIAAVALLGTAATHPASAQSVQWIGPNLAYSLDSPGLSTQSGVSAGSFAPAGYSGSGGQMVGFDLTGLSYNMVYTGDTVCHYGLCETDWWSAQYAQNFDTYSSVTPAGQSSAVYNPGFFVNGKMNGLAASQTASETFTTASSSYFGAMVNTWNSGSTSFSFYDGSTLLGTIDTTGAGTRETVHSDAWSEQNGVTPTADGRAFYLNVDFLNGESFNRLVISESQDFVLTGSPVVSASPVTTFGAGPLEFTDPAPIPVLAGTIPGMLIALAAMVSRRRRAV